MEKVEILKKNNVKVEESLEFWGDLNSYNDNLKEFNDNLKEKLINLEYYKNVNDYNNYAILAHSLKSEAKYLGFVLEAEKFLEHELKGKAHDKDFINNDFLKLKETVEKISNILNDYFNDKANKNILVADDSKIILNFIAKSIDDEYNILRATNGKEAISILDSNHVYAVLLDLNMPSSNGFEVLDYLKHKDLLDKIPVVIITGDDTKDTINKAFSYPILDVLNKPFNEQRIKRVLVSIKTFYEQR